MDAGNGSRGISRAGSANRSTAAGDADIPGGDNGTAAAGTGKRAKKKAVRSGQRTAAAAAPDPVRDEATLKVGLLLVAMFFFLLSLPCSCGWQMPSESALEQQLLFDSSTV